MARLQRAFFYAWRCGSARSCRLTSCRLTSCRLTSCRLTSCRRPLKTGFFGLIFWDFLDFFSVFFDFFFAFFCFRPWVTGVGYTLFYIFKGTLFSIMFGDAIFDSFCIDFLRHGQVLYRAP
jgi:hypothetical protein